MAAHWLILVVEQCECFTQSAFFKTWPAPSRAPGTFSGKVCFSWGLPCIRSGGHITSFPPDVCLREGSVTNIHLERHITHPAELSNTAWWILVARKVGVISEVALMWATFIKTSLQRKQMKLENRNERADSWGSEDRPQTRSGGNKTNKQLYCRLAW